jgi:hypothetical protein
VNPHLRRSCTWTARDTPGALCRTTFFPVCGERRTWHFADEFLQRLSPFRPLETQLRATSRDVILLSGLVRELLADGPIHEETGLFLSLSHGPYHRKTLELSLAAAPEERLTVLEKNLPPKDYIVNYPSLKAAQLAIEFGLHGPWVAFLSPVHGLGQAQRQAGLELKAGSAGAVLVGGAFLLDEPAELGARICEQEELSEWVTMQYIERSEELDFTPSQSLSEERRGI